MLHSKVKSPVVENGIVTKVGSISTSEIVENYKNDLKIDVSYLLKNLNEVEIYKCNTTGYSFFYPFNIGGDDSFYQELEKHSWYYMPWKWEHQEVLKYISENNSLLEVGAANGSFIEKASQNLKINAVGLELNTKAVEFANKSGLNLINESVESHSLKYENFYDIVCSFQVLEHISSVNEFMKANIRCLKKNGLLIISVPNNKGYLGEMNNCLNLPPHHMGLWTKTSLIELGKYFNLELVDFKYEPIQPYHKFQFETEMYKKFNKLPKIMVKASLSRYLESLIYTKRYRAFTIQIVWKKKDI